MTGASRQDGDTWDLASSVGATATMAAAARAMATRTDPARIDDRFAEPLVRAVGVDLLTRLASGETPPGDLVEQVWIDVAKIRGRFYDQFFLDAAGVGVTQAVILAAGLDSRAYRLSWPVGTVVYEVDQPSVIEFKSRALAELGVSPTADRRVVPVTRLAVEKVLTRPICDVVVTVTLVSVTDRESAVKPPSGSASRLRRPSES